MVDDYGMVMTMIMTLMQIKGALTKYYYRTIPYDVTLLHRKFISICCSR